MTMRLHHLVATERRRQRGRLFIAGTSAAIVAGVSVLLLGISGWFITAAALAGTAGAASAVAFNAILPSACIRLFAILRTGCRYSERMSGHDAMLRALARVRPALFAALAAGPAALAMGLSAGDATARMVQDVDEIEMRFVQRPAVWGAWAACLVGFAVLLLADGAAAAGLVAVLACLLIVARCLAAGLDRRGRAIPELNGRLKQDFVALIAAAPELRAYGLEQWAADRIEQRASTLITAQERVTAAGGWFEALLATAAGVAAMLTLVAAREAALPLAALATLAAMVTIDGVAGSIRHLQRRGRLHCAEARLEAMLGPAAPSPAASPAMAWPPSIALPAQAVLLTPGMVAGIAGPSGCGKTTLIERLLRLRDVGRGEIGLGGVEINDLGAAQVRSCFAVAPQDAALLTGTVRENLLLADPAATEAALWDALADAMLADRVAALPQGLDSWLGENGARLSGGERRRLVLARAYLRPAPWLLLDEPTEGLDGRTEAIVVARLQMRLTRRRQGALIVSHRPAPLAACELVLHPRQLEGSVSIVAWVKPTSFARDFVGYASASPTLRSGDVLKPH